MYVQVLCQLFFFQILASVVSALRNVLLACCCIPYFCSSLVLSLSLESKNLERKIRFTFRFSFLYDWTENRWTEKSEVVEFTLEVECQAQVSSKAKGE